MLKWYFERKQRTARGQDIQKRPLPQPVNLPSISKTTVERIALMLRERNNSQRVPYATARFLVLMVEMHRLNMPLTDRKQLAEHLDIAVVTVDVALSAGQANGDITMQHTFEPGNVQNRLNSSVQRRFVIPSDEIRRAVETAEKSGEGRGS